MKTRNCTNCVLRSALLACTFACTLGVSQAALAGGKVFQEALRSTTWVLAKNSEGNTNGTGVLIDLAQKLVMTNFSVIGDARTAVVFFPELEGDRPIVTRQHYLDNVKKLGIRGRVIATDRKRDLALIQLDRVPETAKAIEMATTSVGPGEMIESIGNPSSSEALWVYALTTVRTVYRKQYRVGTVDHDAMILETPTALNAGDGGGPVLNSSGQLVGIAQANAPKTQTFGYSVDVTEMKSFFNSPWKPAPLPVTEVLTKAELKYTQHSTGHYEVQMDLEDKQKQAVFVAKDVEFYQRADVRKIWSLAIATREAPSFETTMKLLQQSARTKLGDWSVEHTNGGDYMIIYCVKMDATASPEAVKSAMEYVATLTSVMKKELTPKAKTTTPTDTLNDLLTNK